MFPPSLWPKVTNAWYALQLTHCGGKYSIERTLALEEFTRKTSLFRVMLLIMTPPLVTVTVLLCQESIPLQNPTAGWRANYGFWPRVGMIGAVLGFVLTNLVGPWFDVPPPSLRQKAVYCTCLGAALVTVGMATSEIWVFPVPFFIISLLVPMAWMFLLLLGAVVGVRAFRLILSRRSQLHRLNNVACLLGVMCVGYPAFQMLFSKATHTVYEVPVLLLLTAFKILMKRIFAHLASHKWDIVPEEIVFTVDCFDALYLVTFLPSLSIVSLGVILFVDLSQNMTDLLELHQRTRSILARIRKAAIIQDDGDNRSLLSAVQLLLLNNEKISGVQVRSCIPHQLSGVEQILLEKLERTSVGRLFRHSSSRIYPPSQALVLVTIPGRVRNTIAVQPHQLATIPPSVADLTTVCSKESRERRTTIVDYSVVIQETLEALFTSECVILAEYLEIIVPILYGGFVFVLAHLPSAQYHTEMTGVTPDNVLSIVSKMFIYALLELFSFVLLAGIMKRNCGIDALYQLAFVLETQSELILSKLMVWMMFTLTYRVAHFGSLNFRYLCHWNKQTNLFNTAPIIFDV